MQQDGCSKIPISSSYIFGQNETVENARFLSDIRFFQYISTNTFFNYKYSKRKYRAIPELLEQNSIFFGNMRHFSDLFLSKPPRCLLQTKRFPSIENS